MTAWRVLAIGLAACLFCAPLRGTSAAQEAIDAASLRHELGKSDEKARVEALATIAARVDETNRRAGGGEEGIERMRKLVDPIRSELVGATKDPSAAVRAVAAYDLAWTTPSRETAAALTRLMNDESKDVRRNAMTGLMMIGSEFPEVRKKVLDALNLQDPGSYEMAASVVAYWEADEALPRLIAGLSSESYSIKAAAARAIAAMGAKAHIALPSLRGELAAVRREEQNQKDLALLLERTIGEVERSTSPTSTAD